jgi:tetratricopeptide (TPR) repeat protein
MQASKSVWWGGIVLLLGAMALLLQGCSVMPQLVWHSDPLSAEEHVRLGTSYEAQGLNDDAAQQYQAALHLQRNNIPALVAWGNLAFGKGDWKTAGACYLRILRRDPTHAGANNNLAMVYLATGKHLDKAERCALMALKQGGPLKPYVLDTLATIYIREGRFAEARKALDEAFTTAPQDNKALRDQLANTRGKLP